MIIQLREEFRRITEDVLGNTFSYRDIAELEDFVQQYGFERPLLNLAPIANFNQNKMQSGAIRYDFNLSFHFLYKFPKYDHNESKKDVIIDQMILFSENFFRELDKNTALFFINPFWTWQTNVLRQFTSNLLCGVVCNVKLDTACNRVPKSAGFDLGLDAIVN